MFDPKDLCLKKYGEHQGVLSGMDNVKLWFL